MCSKNPCEAVWPVSKYGDRGPPEHFQPSDWNPHDPPGLCTPLPPPAPPEHTPADAAAVAEAKSPAPADAAAVAEAKSPAPELGAPVGAGPAPSILKEPPLRHPLHPPPNGEPTEHSPGGEGDAIPLSPGGDGVEQPSDEDAGLSPAPPTPRGDASAVAEAEPPSPQEDASAAAEPKVPLPPPLHPPPSPSSAPLRPRQAAAALPCEQLAAVAAASPPESLGGERGRCCSAASRKQSPGEVDAIGPRHSSKSPVCRL